jgi:hypothetical protein
MQDEAEEALRKLLTGAFEKASPRSGKPPLPCYPLTLRPTSEEASNDARFGDEPCSGARPGDDKHGANLLKLAPFFIAFLHVFLNDFGQWLATWLLAYLAHKRPGRW